MTSGDVIIGADTSASSSTRLRPRQKWRPNVFRVKLFRMDDCRIMNCSVFLPVLKVSRGVKLIRFAWSA